MNTKKWKRDFENTKKQFKNFDNLIELFKNKHQSINGTYELIMGIFLAIFFSVSIADLTGSKNSYIVFLGGGLYLICLIGLIVSITLFIKLKKIQTKIISDLYIEKDKRENQKEMKKK